MDFVAGAFQEPSLSKASVEEKKAFASDEALISLISCRILKLNPIKKLVVQINISMTRLSNGQTCFGC